MPRLIAAAEVGIFHDVAEKACCLLCDGEVDAVVLLGIGIIILFDDVMVCCVTIEPYGVVDVFDNPAPAAVLCSWTPHDIVVAREVEVAEIEVQRHNVHVFLQVNPLGIFLECVSFFLVKLGEIVVEIPCAFFQLAVLNEVDIF